MKKIAYLANSFPEPGEWYVWEEIRELRRSGCEVVPCSFRHPRNTPSELAELACETLYVLPLGWALLLQGCLLLAVNGHVVADLLWRAIRGPEPIAKRLRTLAHTVLGACLAASLDRKTIDHIHVHHGYFSAWAGMVAARLLGVGFSMTLHGSDLLVRGDFIECKLENSKFCVTVSDYNRDHILAGYPTVDPNKILVHRLGIDPELWKPRREPTRIGPFFIASVGRLHAVKNHEFLIRTCGELKSMDVRFRCLIAGDGEEREKLRQLICNLDLQEEVELRGHVPREELPDLYAQADVVVFTSRSEGIPLVAMEAMAMRRVVLAPEITGIPELIVDGETGFLYRADSMEDFLAKLAHIRMNRNSLQQLRRAARQHIQAKFNRTQNLEVMTSDFIRRIDDGALAGEYHHAHSVLQQI